ncbi:hypothetical protein Q5424_00295 [Conexibacter sp. JD483]|uniref:hypothetical protein n=1 Tax=unclassified Conexibacter TaxID=2627773 RepID=UPI00272472A9|nr:MULTISPECIES: hypothetical protein [unclassified Conexibacter]MDO8184196.1 hypothetical protein [Conexibacter sp. CPCC 205706]MDO8197188.1 hypothetical protein [Conexibacter sp. CPCC 205762]MDR9367497.1 hypothetical protein [Conexibacter sp. JD483]
MRVVEYVSQTGLPMVFDNDDDFGALPPGSAGARNYGGLRGKRRLEAIRAMALAADVVTAPSRALVERFEAYGVHRAALLENYVADETVFLRRGQRPGQLVIGWIAGKEHHLDADALPIAPTLERILRVHEHVELRTIGLRLPIKHDRYLHVDGIPFARLPAALAGWDLGMAPLADIPFSRARSNIKLKEYAILGIPWLASSVGEYVGLGAREGGRMVADGDWFEALNWLITHDAHRRRLARRAAKWGAGQTINQHAYRWEKLLHELVGARTADPVDVTLA